MLPFKRDWWGLLKAASALVSVSRYEGHPNVVLETIAAGCPLIVSDIPEHREFLNEASALLVPPEDPAALAQAIDNVLRDGQAARRRAGVAEQRLGELSVAAAADAYESVYQRVLQGRKG
jgi:glycosyltransferase involved in cell wall biosynthesis